MNWTNIYQNTLIPQIPDILNSNFSSFKRYLDVFYSESNGIIIVPINTTGRVKGGTGEFTTGIFDNLIVRNQFTNLYSNNTAIDSDFYNALAGIDTSTRVADPSLGENINFRYIDINKPVYKLLNDNSIGFRCINLGQEFQIIWDVSGNSPFTIMLDPSTKLNVNSTDASLSRITLLCDGIDASSGNSSWYIKSYSGIFSTSLI
jgi:hypothetical protein